MKSLFLLIVVSMMGIVGFWCMDEIDKFVESDMILQESFEENEENNKEENDRLKNEGNEGNEKKDV